MHDVYNDDQTFGLVEKDLEESGEEEAPKLTLALLLLLLRVL